MALLEEQPFYQVFEEHNERKEDYIATPEVFSAYLNFLQPQDMSGKEWNEKAVEQQPVALKYKSIAIIKILKAKLVK